MTGMDVGYTPMDVQTSAWMTIDEHRIRGGCWNCRPDGTCGQLAWALAYEAERRRPEPEGRPA